MSKYGEPWWAGRRDMLSYTGDGQGPFKNVYADDPNGKIHLGDQLPAEMCRAFDALDIDCRDIAERVAACVNACAGIEDPGKVIPELIRMLRILASPIHSDFDAEAQEDKDLDDGLRALDDLLALCPKEVPHAVD